MGSTRKRTAVEWLGQLHYQVCNGGLEQACYNGYVDGVIGAYGSFGEWVEALKSEVSGESGRKAVEAAEMISGGVDKISLTRCCPDCGGSGSIRYEEEDEDGESVECEETCTECNGSGTIDVETYAEVDFEGQPGVDAWDDEYYSRVDSDAIDDLTGQSHTHSVILDAIAASA